jgi:hypothetical protein
MGTLEEAPVSYLKLKDPAPTLMFDFNDTRHYVESSMSLALCSLFFSLPLHRGESPAT